MTADPRRTIKGSLLTQLIRGIFPLNGFLLETGDRLSGNVGLSSALWQVLGAINDCPRTVPQIGRMMGLARQSVQRSVNIMAEDGLVEFVPNPDHKTSHLVQPTTNGQRAYSKVMLLQAAWANGLAKSFKTKDLEVAIAVVEALNESLHGDI